MIAPYHIEPANCQQRTGIDTASEGGETVAINGGWHECRLKLMYKINQINKWVQDLLF